MEKAPNQGPSREASGEDSKPPSPVKPAKRRRHSSVQKGPDSDESENEALQTVSTSRANISTTKDPTPTPSSATSDTDVDLPRAPARIGGLVWGYQSTNSCTVDGVLTMLKINSLRSKYDFFANFKSKKGVGADIETKLRTTLSNLTITPGQPETRQQQLRNSHTLHFYWSHFIGLTDPVPDFIGSPSSKILEHLEPISLFSFYLECLCPNKTSHIVYKHFVYFNSQEEFDRFLELGLLPDRSLRHWGSFCSTCLCYYQCKLTVPDTTWLIQFRFSPSVQTRDTSTPLWNINGSRFRLAATLYERDPDFRPRVIPMAQTLELIDLEDPSVMRPPPPGVRKINASPSEATSHMFSRIFSKGKNYSYDDMREGGRLIPADTRWPVMTQDVRTHASLFLRIPPLRRDQMSKQEHQSDKDSIAEDSDQAIKDEPGALNQTG